MEKKSFDGGEFDNQQMIKDIISLRDQKAKLLGYENYAAFVLEERMAKSPQKVESFLHELLEKATPYSQKRNRRIKKLLLKLTVLRICKAMITPIMQRS